MAAVLAPAELRVWDLDSSWCAVARGQAGSVLGLCAWPWVLQTETCLFCSCLLQAAPAVAFQVIFLFFYAGLVMAGLAHILVAKFLTKGSGREGREGREGHCLA